MQDIGGHGFVYRTTDSRFRIDVWCADVAMAHRPMPILMFDIFENEVKMH